MILGNFKIASKHIVQNANGNYTVFIMNGKGSEMFLEDVIRAYPNGVPVSPGDTVNLIIDGDATQIPVVITEVKEYCVDYSDILNGSDRIAALVFNCSKIGPIHGNSDLFAEIIPEIEPFPIESIFCSGDFIAIRLSGDIDSLVTQPELYQKYVVDRYSKFRYLGKVYYHCNCTGSIMSSAGARVSRLCINRDDGHGLDYIRVNIDIIASTKAICSSKEHERFLKDCKIRYMNGKGE